jgi:16S rRNA processing protein RimM
MNKYLELGQIVNVKGLKGEVKVNPFTEDNTRFETLSKVFVKKAKGDMKEYSISKVGYNKNQVIIKFKESDISCFSENLQSIFKPLQVLNSSGETNEQ